MSARRVPVCTGCLRAWDPSQYRTCDACRSRNRKRYLSTPRESNTRNPNPRNTAPMVPSPTLTNSDLPSKRTRRHSNSSLENDPAPEVVRRAVHLPEDKFKRREAASQYFPPEISSSQIRGG
ncbi:hypothetical protein V8E54_000893 [Elaphomyces granulatus]